MQTVKVLVAERFEGWVLTEVTLFLWTSGSGIPNFSFMMVLVFGCAGLYNRRMVNANLCWKKKQADKQAKVVVCVRKDPLNEENEPEYFQNMNVGLPSPQGRSCQDLPTGCAH